MDTHITIPMARLIELETAEHERDILRTAANQKHAEYEDLKACAANNARNLAREAHTWSKAADAYATSEAKLVEALRELVDLEDMRLRLRQLHEMGHGTDYENYHRRLPLAWAAARAALRPND